MDDIHLTDEEWMSLINGDRDGLPRCCANVSALRDDLIALARNSGRLDLFAKSSIAMHLTWVFPEHDVPSVAMQKVLDHFDITPFGEDDAEVAEVVTEHYAKRHRRLTYEFGGDA